jgi:hypothetical protein
LGVSQDNPITRLLSNGGVLQASDARVVLREAYEQTYHIYDHDRVESSPLAIVAMHPSENPFQDSLLAERMKDFARKKIGKWFNMSFTEFIRQPRADVEMMLEVASELNRTDANDTDDIVRKLGL